MSTTSMFDLTLDRNAGLTGTNLLTYLSQSAWPLPHDPPNQPAWPKPPDPPAAPPPSPKAWEEWNNYDLLPPGTTLKLSGLALPLELPQPAGAPDPHVQDVSYFRVTTYQIFTGSEVPFPAIGRPKGGNPLTRVTCNVPRQQSVQITPMVLLAYDGATATPAEVAALEAAFGTWKGNTDPLDHIVNELRKNNAQVKAAYQLLYSFTLLPIDNVVGNVKVGNVKEDRRPETRLLQHLEDSGDVVFVGPETDPNAVPAPIDFEHLNKKKGTWVAFPQDTYVATVSSRPPNPPYEVPYPVKAADLIDAANKAPAPAGCSGSGADFNVDTYQLSGDFVMYPDDVRMIRRTVHWHIDLLVTSIDIYFDVPITQVHFSSLQVWAVARYRKPQPQRIVNDIKQCVYIAAASGTIAACMAEDPSEAISGYHYGFQAATIGFRIDSVPCLSSDPYIAKIDRGWQDALFI